MLDSARTGCADAVRSLVAWSAGRFDGQRFQRSQPLFSVAGDLDNLHAVTDDIEVVDEVEQGFVHRVPNLQILVGACLDSVDLGKRQDDEQST